MNLSQFYRLADFLVTAYDRGGLESAYKQLVDTLQNQINSPNQQNMESLGGALKNLESAVKKCEFDKMPPTWRPLVEELALENYVGEILYQWPDEQIKKSGPILTEALSSIQKDFEGLKGQISHLRQVKAGLDCLGYEPEKLQPGEAELSIQLPRNIFNDEVGGFAKKVSQFDQIVSTCSEVVTGSAERIILKQISTTDPLLIAIAGAPTVFFVLRLIDKILDAYKKVVEIKEIQARTKAIGLDGGIAEQIGAQAKKVIEEKMGEFVEEVKSEFKLNHELIEKLKIMSMKLAALIDNGARLEGWAEPPDSGENEEVDEKEDKQRRDTIDQIRNLSRELQKFSGQGEPVLKLPPPDDPED